MAMKHKPREAKGDICGISDCKERGVKSLSSKKVKQTLTDLTLKSSAQKRVHLCKRHYKEFKKKTKKERELDRLGWE